MNITMTTLHNVGPAWGDMPSWSAMTKEVVPGWQAECKEDEQSSSFLVLVSVVLSALTFLFQVSLLFQVSNIGSSISMLLKKIKGEKTSSSSTDEAPPLTPQDIQSVLEGRGWEAEIVRASAMPDMKPICPKGILKCVDGRGSDNTELAGPKMPGGIYAIAHNRGVTTTEGLKSITKEVTRAGHMPSVHGDDSSDMLGCGFFKLWLTGRFDDMGYPRPQFDADQGAKAVKDAGGYIEMHHGSHAEKVVLINLVENKTLDPIEDDQRFIVDGWAAGKFGLDVPKFLVAAAATVEMLGGPKKAKIIIP